MDNMHLVTGYLGREHITAVDQGAFNAALIGTGQFVLDKGKVFKAQVISSNQIRILDGELMMQGRFVRLEPDTYVDLTIENGAQGYYRNDLIVARYTKDISTGAESVNLVVVKGNATTSVPVDPAYTTGDIASGSATTHDFPLWRIPLTGITVGAPVALFGEPFMDSMRTLPDIRRQVNEIHGEVDKQLADYDKQLADYDKQIDEKIAAIESYTKAETLDDNIKTAFGVGSSAVPKDVFEVIKATLDDRARIAAGSYVGTDVGGPDGVVTLTFDFAPKVLMLFKSGGIVEGYSDYPTIGYPQALTTSFNYGLFDRNALRAKRSDDGKTISWYSLHSWYDEETDESWYDSSDGFNNRTTYYYVAIG